MEIMVDVEADGPCPGLFSMVSFGAVAVETPITKTFYTELKPISDNFIKDALLVSGFTREQTLKFKDPYVAMINFNYWLKQFKNPRFISDNNGFDWQFINYYCWKFLEFNPFGHSSTNLGSLYKGFVKDMFKNFKHLRGTKHSHNALDDAKGNTEAFLKIIKMGLKV